MPWRTLCGFPPTDDTIALLVPNGRWRPDTVITDIDGNEIFVLIDQSQEMRSYEAIFGDLEGRKLVCIKRHLQKAFWRDGFYFCSYRPNYAGQKALTDRDRDNKKVYPFSYLEIHPLKGRFLYRLFDDQEKLKAPRMIAQNPWLGFMTVCCTPIMRGGKFTCSYRKNQRSGETIVHVDQWKNMVEVGPGNDLLAALCMAYVFDRMKCQPLVTVFGRDEDEELEADDVSIESQEGDNNEYEQHKEVELENMPGSMERTENDAASEPIYYDDHQADYLDDDKAYPENKDLLDDAPPPEQAPPLHMDDSNNNNNNNNNKQPSPSYHSSTDNNDNFGQSLGPTELV